MESPFGIGYHNGEATGSEASSPSSASMFVQGQTEERPTSIIPPPQQSEKDSSHQTEQQQQDRIVVDSDTTADENDAAIQGRLRAQAILRRFQQQQETLLLSLQQGNDSSVPNSIQSMEPSTHSFITPTSISPPPTTTSSAFVQQRRKAAIREKQRLQQAWSKNFAYLAHKQSLASQQMDAQIVAAQQREQAAQEHYQHLLQQRQQRHKELMLQKSSQTAGIGTQQRKRAQVTRAKWGQSPNSHQLFQASLYLTGIPTDGSVTINALRQIFQAYGSVTKVHFYRDKKTGDLKGDGLVVYESAENQVKRDELLQIVCSQVSWGEELLAS